MQSRKNARITLIFMMISLCFSSVESHAFLFHATGKAAAKKILTTGINPGRFKSKARFGKGFYSSKRPSTALAEKGSKNAVIRMGESSYLKKNTINLEKPSSEKLHALLGSKADLRGGVKNHVIGPKIGHRVGQAAAKAGKALEYRSARNGGANLFIPKRLFKGRPNIVRPEKMIKP